MTLATCWQSAAAIGVAGCGVPLATSWTLLIGWSISAAHDAVSPSANSAKPEVGLRKWVWL